MDFYYFVDKDKVRRGPFSVEKLLSNDITPDTFIWCKGMSSWQKARDVKEVAVLLKEEDESVLAKQPEMNDIDNVQSQYYSNNEPASSVAQTQLEPIRPEDNLISDVNLHHKKDNNTGLFIIMTVLFLLLACVGGYLYYDMIYMPKKIDREAPRYYTMADKVVLRSSRSSGADFNKMASLPFGTELITYERDAEWSKVKVKAPNSDDDNKEGFVASLYTLNKPDFFLLNSIFGNQDSREVVNTTKCRLSLLNYYKTNHLLGKIDAQERTEAGIKTVPNSSNQWQVIGRPKNAKQNIYLFKRLYNKNSQFTDFAVIITNIVTGERRLLYFFFDDDETPHLLAEQPAPQEGFIKDIYISYNGWTGEYELSAAYFD